MGACSPRKILEIRCSDIASEAIWDKTRAVVAIYIYIYIYIHGSRSIVLPVYVCICYKPADLEFPRERVLRLAEQQVGDITR